MSFRHTMYALGVLALAGCPTSDDAIVDTDEPGPDTDAVDTDVPDTDAPPDTDVAPTDDTDAVDTDDTGEPPVEPLTCGDLGIPTLSLAPALADTAPFVRQGRFAADAAILLASCAATFSEQVVTFTAPTAGVWEFSTDGVGTTSATSLSLRTACDDTTEQTCDVGGAGRRGARATAALAAGETIEVVIGATTAAARGWQLTVRDVDHVAAADEPCGDDVSCEAGTACVQGTVDATCVTFDTPAITASTVAWTSTSAAPPRARPRRHLRRGRPRRSLPVRPRVRCGRVRHRSR